MHRELSVRLGVEWGPVRKNSAEVTGGPVRVSREYSQRSIQIAEWLATAGRSGPAATDEAILATRASKHTPADWAVVEAEWRTRADGLGWARPHSSNSSPPPRPPIPGAGSWWMMLSGPPASPPSSLPASINVSPVVRSCCQSAMARACYRVRRMEGMAPRNTSHRQRLASPAIVAIGDHQTAQTSIHAHGRVVPDDRQSQYTSQTLLGVERRLLDHLAAGTDAGCGVLDRVLVEAAITTSMLGSDQAAAIRALAAGGDRVAVIVGRAGTGKTHTLGTLRTVYEQSGFTVIGLAPSRWLPANSKPVRVSTRRRSPTTSSTNAGSTPQP